MQRFDVVIIGGGVIGSSAAYFLSSQPDFTGTIAVIEKDPTYAEAATPRSAGGVRLQFSTAENVLMGAFGASFIFLVGAHYTARSALSDTSQAERQTPLYRFDAVDQMVLPQGCVLIGVELLDEATLLPSFRHPMRAAYVLGPEQGELSPALIARCDHIVRIPSSFCINLAMAGAIVMYDRVRCLGRFPPRPLTEGGPAGGPLPSAGRKIGRA